MLFGLGWPSVLLFFMSLIPTYTPKAQGHLLTFGWLFVACWLVCAAAGIMTDNHTPKQATVFTANYIMSLIGSVLGAVLTASYAYYNWPWMYISGAAAVVGAAVFAVQALQQQTDGGSPSNAGVSRAAAAAAAGQQGAGAGVGAAAGSAGGAPPAPAVGDLIDLGDS